MYQVRLGGSWAAAVVIGAVWAGTALGQYKPLEYTPPSMPSGPSSVSDPDYIRREQEYVKNWSDNQEKQQQQQLPAWWSGFGGAPEAPTTEHLMTWMTVLLIAIAAVILLWVGARVVLHRSSGPTDPEKLAMSDPWVRSHLAQSGPQPNQPPPPNAPRQAR